MYCITIPVKTKEEAKEISDYHFGAMMWDDTEKGKLKAYPYDSENPVVIGAK